MNLLSVVFLFFCLCFLPITSLAEIKTFVHTVKQPFSGSQSPDDARVAAIHKAKREVLEKAGTYLETLTIVEDGRLTKEQVLALASGVLKTEIISQEPYTTGEGYGVIIKVRVRIDTGQINYSLKTLMNDKTAMKQLVELRKRDKELLDRIERLEEADRRLTEKKAPQTIKKNKKKALKKDFQQTTKGLDVVALKNQASELWKYSKYSNPTRAIELLDKVIELDPGDAEAYSMRGNAYTTGLKQHNRAIQDFNKAIELKPDYTVAYNNRGLAYNSLNENARAIQDFNKAIELDPDDAVAYGSRGIAYKDLNQNARAIQDYDKSIELDPTYAPSYYNRGNLYNILKQYDRAIQDYSKTIELAPDVAMPYNARGDVYMVLQKIVKGCTDLKKACSLGDCDNLEHYMKQGFCQ